MVVVAIVSDFSKPRFGARAEFAGLIHRPCRRLGCTRVDGPCGYAGLHAPGCLEPLPGPGLPPEICGDALDLRPPLPMPMPRPSAFVFVPLVVGGSGDAT